MRERLPSRALRVLHIILIAFGIAFSFGFAGYLLLVSLPRAQAGGGSATGILALIGLFAAGGAALVIYLRGFLARQGR
jgi:hypothetical protein